MPRSRLLTAATTAVVLLLLTACGTDDGDSASPSDAASAGEQRVFAEPEEGAYPVTLTHGLGETTITEQPQRVVVIGWGGSDLAVELGTVPVAQGVAAGIEDDYYPWFAEAVEDLGAPLPSVDASLERGEVDLEYVLAQDPDLVLAVGSGISSEEYERLSEIAPTVAHVEPWGTSLEDHLELVGAALGQPSRAQEILTDFDALLATAAAEQPEFAGLSYLQSSYPGDDGSVVVYSSIDERSQALESLGFVPMPEVTEALASSGSASSFVMSLEELRVGRPDVIVTVADEATWQVATATHPVFATWEPVAEGRVALIEDIELGMAFSTATPLGLTWGLDPLLEILSAGVNGAGPTPTDP